MKDKDNPLYVLDGKKLGEHILRLGKVKKGAFAGVFIFSLFIEENDIVSGLYYTHQLFQPKKS